MFALVAKFFWGLAYSTDLIGLILRASESRRKMSRWLDESAYSRKMNREEKQAKTVSFQSTNKESMVWREEIVAYFDCLESDRFVESNRKGYGN